MINPRRFSRRSKFSFVDTDLNRASSRLGGAGGKKLIIILFTKAKPLLLRNLERVSRSVYPFHTLLFMDLKKHDSLVVLIHYGAPWHGHWPIPCENGTGPHVSSNCLLFRDDWRHQWIATRLFVISHQRGFPSASAHKITMMNRMTMFQSKSISIAVILTS